MQILNLNNNTLTNGVVTIDNFPDGQVNIHLEGLNRKEGEIVIFTSLRNGNDIMLMLMASDIIKRNGMIVTELHIPYLYSARMDRVMDFNQPFSLSIVANLINSVGAKKVCLYEPHNTNVVLNLINNSCIISPLEDYIPNTKNDVLYLNNVCVVYPDRGAQARYLKRQARNLICCTKKRDPRTNMLSGFAIEDVQLTDTDCKTFVIVDDLCDGGGTFCGIASLLRETYGNDIVITLVVTHLIQHSAISKLVASGIDNIVTTDSFIDKSKVPIKYKDNIVIVPIQY